MTIDYINQAGVATSYEAPLTVSAAYANISSHIAVDGYWDYNADGLMESYGSAKWEPGTHEMFTLNFYIAPTFRNGYVIFDGNISSGTDRRGPILGNILFYKRTYLWVGYMLGDVSGDEKIDVSDVTILIGYVLGNYELDEFQVAAADVNQDGTVDVDDVTRLINTTLN